MQLIRQIPHSLTLVAMLASTAYATNGVNLIGTGAISRAMGGTGVAFYSNPAEAISKNPALMEKTKNSETIQVDLTYFDATVKSYIADEMPLNTDQVQTGYEGTSTGHLDQSFIPRVGYVTEVDDEMNFGFGFLGIAGLGVDHIENPQLRKMKSSMMLMQIVPAFSSTVNNVHFGFAPVLGFGSLSINYDEDPSKKNDKGVLFQSKRPGLFDTNIGGETLESAIGLKLGFAVDVDETFTFGGSFISPLKYEYQNIVNFEQFTLDGMMFEVNKFLENNRDPETGKIIVNETVQGVLDTIGGILGAATAIDAETFSTLTSSQLDAAAPTKENLDNLVLEQPWEAAFGFSYKPSKKLTMTVDVRHIAWASTEGYGDFGWQNQEVFAAGLEYRRGKIALRAGFNYAESPLKPYEEEGDSFGINLVDIQGHQVMRGALDMLNMVGFPAISTTHYTFGFGYDVSSKFEWNFAAVISPEAKTTRKGYYNPLGDLSLFGVTTSPLNYEYTTTMVQNSYTINMMYHF